MKKWRETLFASFYCFICLHVTSYAETITDNHQDSISSLCDNTSGCSTTTEPVECQEVCGCNDIYKFDDSKGECVIDYEYLKERTRSNNLMHTEKIRESTERVFQGIIYCAIFFIICASMCVISACVFCCRIHYSDEKLKNEVKGLAKKLKINYHQRESTKKTPRDPKVESCNVIVEDANIMCV